MPMSLLLRSPCYYFIYMPRLYFLCSFNSSHLPIAWDFLGYIVIRRLSFSTLSFARTGVLAHMWSHFSEQHSTWCLRHDEWKCDPVLQENIGAIDKSGNRTKWSYQELSHSFVFPLFAGHTNSWHSRPLMVMSLNTSLPLISCPKPTCMLKVWSFAYTHMLCSFRQRCLFTFYHLARNFSPSCSPCQPPIHLSNSCTSIILLGYLFRPLLNRFNYSLLWATSAL